MTYQELKLKLEQLEKGLDAHNYKDIKQKLIELRNIISHNFSDNIHQAELFDALQAVFEKIKILSQADQQLFEQESEENYVFLKKKVIEAIDFTQNNIDNPAKVWDHLVTTQQYFKGRRLIGGKREQLFGTLQKLFDLLKKRRGDVVKEQEKAPNPKFKDIDGEVKYLVRECKKADTEKTWAQMLLLKDKVSQIHLPAAHRKKLIDTLQIGFDILKQRREEKHSEFLIISAVNAEFIEERLKNAAEEMDSQNDFRHKWDCLLAIQKEFRERKIEKDVRNELYNKLQELFHRLKTEHYSHPSDFEKLADENYSHLKKLVDDAFEEVQITNDFKKTKATLIKIQADFKGRKMRSFEREKLFSRLQSAFGILHKRNSEINQQQTLKQ